MLSCVIFKRVGDRRPYPDHQLGPRDWAALPPRQVRLDELVTTKDTLQLDALLEEDSTFFGDLFAHVVEWDGDLYLEDGLHRALRAALQQRTVLHARVHTVGRLGVRGRHVTTAVTLVVLVAILLLGTCYGMKSLFAPLPGDDDAPKSPTSKCRPPTSRRVRGSGRARSRSASTTPARGPAWPAAPWASCTSAASATATSATHRPAPW